MSLASFSLILGVFCYVFGLPMVMGDDKHLQWRSKLLKDVNSIRMLSLLLLAIAVTALKRQSDITADGEGLMVAFVWLALLEGAVMAIFPAWYVRLKSQTSDRMMSSDGATMFFGVVAILFGAFFTYMGVVLA